MRRLVHGAAALVVAAIGSLVWAQPAQAAPPAALCSVQEWSNPGNYVDCARRLREKAAAELGCVTAPTPGSPTAGMAGFFTTRPSSSLRDGVAGRYSLYGVGGYGLDTYDVGCLGKVKHPDLVFWNTMASAEFSTAASIMGGANALRERAYDPGSMWGWSDQFLRLATDAVYRYVFTPFGAVALAVVGIFLIWRSRLGSMSEAMRLSAWALFVIVAVTGVFRWPVAAADGADVVASSGLKVVHRVLGPGPQDVPAGRCVLGPAACEDHRDVAVRASDVATEAVLYRTWLRAVLGSSDSATAVKYGPALYDATTLSWGEAERADRSVRDRQALVEQKAQTFAAIAEAIRAEDPQAYEHLQGVRGQDRFGAGVVAVLSALAFAVFDVLASLVILFGFLVFRVAIILIPLLGTVAVFQPASAGLRRVFHMVGSAVFNIVIFGAGAGAYLTATSLIFGSSLPGAAQVVAVALVGAVLAVAMRPFRHMVHTATGRSRADDSLVTRLFRAGKDIHAGQRSAGLQSAAAPDAQGAPARPRPEAATAPAPRRSTTATVLGAVAPTAAAAAGHPWLSAAMNAARPRPETRS